MRQGLLILFLLVSLSSLAQYKRIILGVNYSSNLWYTKHPDKLYPFPRRATEFSQYGLSLQYNLKKVLTLSFEPVVEFYRRNPYRIDVYAPQYIDWRYRYESCISHRLTLPLMLKATLGNKFLFIPSFGINCSFLLPTSSFQAVEYSIYDDYQQEPLNQVHYTLKPGDADVTEVNWVWGIGLAYQWNEKFLFSMDTRAQIKEFRYPVNRDNYSSSPKARLVLSIAYQLNFKKNSDYKFSTYSLSFED